jgi:hypothetical protein
MPPFFGNTIQEIDLVQFLFEILFSFSFLPMDCNFKCIQSMSRKVWAENNPPDDQRAFNQRQPLARARVCPCKLVNLWGRAKNNFRSLCACYACTSPTFPPWGGWGVWGFFWKKARAQKARNALLCVCCLPTIAHCCRHFDGGGRFFLYFIFHDSQSAIKIHQPPYKANSVRILSRRFSLVSLRSETKDSGAKKAKRNETERKSCDSKSQKAKNLIDLK